MSLMVSGKSLKPTPFKNFSISYQFSTQNHNKVKAIMNPQFFINNSTYIKNLAQGKQSTWASLRSIISYNNIPSHLTNLWKYKVNLYFFSKYNTVTSAYGLRCATTQIYICVMEGEGSTSVHLFKQIFCYGLFGLCA